MVGPFAFGKTFGRVESNGIEKYYLRLLASMSHTFSYLEFHSSITYLMINLQKLLFIGKRIKCI